MAYNKEKSDKILQEFLSLESVDEKFIDKQMTIAAQIDNYLKENGWTQKELAEKAGFKSQSQLTEIMSGHGNPTLKTITKLEEALGKDIIVSPDFYEEELEEKGWIHPERTVHISAGVFRSESYDLNDFITINPNYEGCFRVKRNQYSTAEEMHLHKPTGTHG
ncbi:MAG: helix-turn-helix transcriptional regulator [Candidatus Paceibacterota bacterium]